MSGLTHMAELTRIPTFWADLQILFPLVHSLVRQIIRQYDTFASLQIKQITK